MGRIAIPTEVDCPHCRARNPAAADRCQACGKTLAIYIGPAEQFPRRLDLGSLMLVVALVAACLGATHEVPVLGIFLILVSVPALLRTFVWTARLKGYGRPMLWPEKLGAFAASLGVVWLITMGATAAFAFAFALGSLLAEGLQAALAGGPWGGLGAHSLVESIGVITGAVAAVAAGYHLVKAVWPIKD